MRTEGQITTGDYPDTRNGLFAFSLSDPDYKSRNETRSRTSRSDIV
jgi:hypothetical protein